MHVFERYAAPSAAAEIDLVRRHPFALVVSADDGAAPVATHLPVIVPSGSAPTGLVGATLFGHLARVNPHWESFRDGREVLLVFAGPHGYVSPTVYGYDPAVPTWNYAAVHLTGTVELTDDASDTLHIVSETVRALEVLRRPEWDMTASLDTFAGLVEHVVAFRIRVTSASSNFKLSQDMPADVRDRVRRDFRATGNPALADLMEQVAP
ncbi:FMN-binding negative transcriptional regulator [Saccharopolyspora shandongensis]|uniref:FMN-binding negative transcriptional regulator n=1 Tax=Saccharopolyspora shandongensis TaxID=418495 RepID=UPI0033E2EDFB